MRKLIELVVYVAAFALPMTASAESPDQFYARGYAAAKSGDHVTCVAALQNYLLLVPTISLPGRMQIERQIALCRGSSIQSAQSRVIDVHGHTMQDLIRMSGAMSHKVD